MENSIILEVKTVPAFDSSVLRPLAAFTVLRKCDDSIMLASVTSPSGLNRTGGWITLKDYWVDLH